MTGEHAVNADHAEDAPATERAFTHSEAGTPESTWQVHPAFAAVPELELDAYRRLVVVAAHPDDETLMAGGLIATAAARSMGVDVVVATSGEASHPDSPTHSREDLTRVRRAEVVQAVRALAPQAHTHLLDLGDGNLAERQEELLTVLVEILGRDGPETLLVSTWRGDRHPDHEAAAAAAAGAAWRTDAAHLEAPLWLWHWGEPADLDALAAASPLHRLSLEPDGQERKRAAVEEHTSQTSPLGPETGNEVLLSEEMLAHFARPFEVFIASEPSEPSPFQDLHGRDPDPWETQSSWYEARKRALTLAALPAARYRSALELGCSVGTLARDLATRCDRVLAVDESSAALDIARTAVTDPRVEFRLCQVPEQWPEDAEAGVTSAPDLVVVSEIGYFLSPGRMRALAERIEASGAATVVACHWRHPIVGWPLTGADVHAILDETLSRTRTVTVRDPDFDLAVWVTSDESAEAGT